MALYQRIASWWFEYRAAWRYDHGPGRPMSRHKKPWYRTW